MVDKLSPSGQTAPEQDYQKKFNRAKKAPSDTSDIKEQEKSGGDASWKTKADSKTNEVSKSDNSGRKKGRFGFKGRRRGKIRQGSAFVFVVGLILAGVWYTSVLAPNILLVNIKEMYTNDLADATTALEIYTQIMYFYKIGPLSGQDCNMGQPMNTQSIKCKLTTMSRSQKESFERQGFSFGIPIPDTVKTLIPGSDKFDFCAQKVYEDNRDDGDPRNDKPESRYRIFCILPPNYKQIIDSVKAAGTSSIMKTIQGNGDAQGGVTSVLNQLLNPLKDATKSPQALLNGILSEAPITSGPQLWLYSQLSTTAKEQVYSVFNPRSSFFTDARFKQRIKSRYNMTKSVTVTGNTEAQVNSSFDSSVQKTDGGIDGLTGQPNPTDGVSLASLSSPLNLTQLKSLASTLTGGLNINTIKSFGSKLPAIADLETAGNLLATNTYTYTDLMCSWYTIGEMTNNALTRAKATTAARFALQYLKAADAIKAGTAEEVPTNVLASKLAEGTLGGYGGSSATDSLIYHSITYGDSVPKSIGGLGKLLEDAAAIVTYNLSAYENIGTLAASWAQIIPNAAALGAIAGTTGELLPPPANATMPGSTPLDSQYCESGATTQSTSQIKPGDSKTTKCIDAINAMAPIGTQGLVADATVTAGQTCPEPHYDQPDDTFEGEYLMLPSQKIVQATLTPYVAGWFGVNTMLSAAITQQLYTSHIKGIAANYALFSGMGELLGDMAQSRGLMPSNTIDMEAYLHLGEVLGVQKDQDAIAQYNAKKNPFDPYNKFSFVGSIFSGLSPSVDNRAPLFATINNILSLVSNGAQHLGQMSMANAFYHSQPSLITGDGSMPEREAAYLLRLSSAFCPIDLQYLAIGITPDIMCNVRYSMPLEDIGTALNLSGVIDYMTQSHSDAYNSQTQELTKRIGEADVEGNKAYLSAQLATVEAVQNRPFIDKKTGKPTPGGEYDKYLQYCVNRLDPWGRSAIAETYRGLSDKEKEKRQSALFQNDENAGSKNAGDPNERIPNGIPTMAVTATQSDQGWYTGSKCTRAGQLTDPSISQMLQYFRAYTTLCSVDGSMSGIVDCTEPDHVEGDYSDPFYLNNNILYTSWY
ncbi:MAG: hypothetical protein H6797_05895 [Candidatus Nomurabacteria bacterium]|nr:MAG: hypothetical protein H6797_05895 [Candidatus Nomurabacteria bacterium]